MAQPGTSRGGFVLVPGHSTRMGRDKALLKFHGSTFAGGIAECVRRVAGNVTLVGPPDRYRELGYTVIPDRVPGCGPLGGVYTALSSSHAEWNLIVACDMPLVHGCVRRRRIRRLDCGLRHPRIGSRRP
jgi:molybdopterin-guanine dinucleotide biosynthesis protein A